MLTRRLIACLDVRAGRVVKGVQFVGLRDVGDPVELATRYEAEGADEIVYLDIAASAEERATLLELARRTAECLFIPLTIGGGIRTADDIAAALRAGADKVGLNSAAVRRPEVLTEGADRFGAGLGLRLRGHLCLSHGDCSSYEKCDWCPSGLHGMSPLVLCTANGIKAHSG